jgi:predicted dehydrogenase
MPVCFSALLYFIFRIKLISMNKNRKTISRRHFIGSSTAGVAGVMIIPSISCGRTGQSLKTSGLIRLGFIGLGQQAMYLLDGFMRIPDVEVLAGCDVYGIKRKRFENRVNEYYAGAGKKIIAASFEKYDDLLERKDIDAVVIAVPDHAHAMIAIAALKAGKDVYLEKPVTLTIYEGQQLRATVRETGKVLGVGSQQRSDPNFQHAVRLVQTGAIGTVTSINAYVGAPPTPYNLPEEQLPTDLNWDLWLGPLPASIHYNKELNPPISLDPPMDEQFWGGWRWYKEMGGGFTTDWGAHMFDVAQWGLGMDGSGPVEISPIGDGSEFIKWKYASGVVLTSEPFDEKRTKGVRFNGDKGWLEISRKHFASSDPELIPPPPAASADEGPYETKIPHLTNFIEAVRKRTDPIVPVETGHRSCTVCTLGNIAVELGRSIRWDPSSETFVDDVDDTAAKLLHYDYRKPCRLI